eukprot:UC1_evm3s1127
MPSVGEAAAAAAKTAPTLFGRVTALKRQADQETAAAMLLRAAHQVEPIMRKRGWRVGHLAEFCPKSPQLLGLNVNRGQKINVRLRPGSGGGNNSSSGFYPFESVLGTLLHELCHNVHGNHSAEFYTLLDEITAECERLMAQGVTSIASMPTEAFTGRGMRLGGSRGGAISAAQRRELIRRAAERRRGRTLGAAGSRTLGGGTGTGCGGGVADINTKLTPRQMAARAAMRRLQDKGTC